MLSDDPRTPPPGDTLPGNRHPNRKRDVANFFSGGTNFFFDDLAHSGALSIEKTLLRTFRPLWP
jgi:hypothetical protein